MELVIQIEKLKIAIAEKEGHLNALREKKVIGNSAYMTLSFFFVGIINLDEQVRAETDVTELDKNMNEIDQERVKLTAEVESTKQDVS